MKLSESHKLMKRASKVGIEVGSLLNELRSARKRDREVFKVLSYHCESYMPNGYCESNCNSVRHFKCTMSKCPLLAEKKARKG